MELRVEPSSSQHKKSKMTENEKENFLKFEKNEERFKKSYLDQIEDDNTDDYDETNIEVNDMVSIKAGCCSFNPVTPTGRKFHQLQMILLPFIPIASLVIQNSYAVANIIFLQTDVRELQMQVDSAVEMGTVLTGLQQERVEVAYYVFSNGTARLSNNRTSGREKLEQTFQVTDEAIEAVYIWPDFSFFGADEVLGSKLLFQIHLENLRDDLDDDDVDTVKNKMNYYTTVSAHIMEAMIKSIKDTNLSNIWKLMIAYKDMIRAVEYFGITIVEGLSFFGEGSLNSRTYINYVTHDALAWKTLNQTKDFVTIIREKLENMTHQYENLENVFKWRLRIIENVAQTVDLREADDYYSVMVRLSDELREMQQVLLELIKEHMKQQLQSADTKAMLSILLLSIVLLLSPIIIFLIRNASITIQACAVSITNKTNQLKKEKRRCDRLLCQMLPPHVAIQLKKRQSIPPECYDLATVYVCDIVNYDDLRAYLTPSQTLNLMNSICNMMDGCIQKYDVFKTNVIGEGYQVVSGIPQRNGVRHVQEIAHMAMDIIASASQLVIPEKPGERLIIKSGFNSGSVIAGVVGCQLPRYCIFGDTVNIATRMKITGEAMKVHVSQFSKELLEECEGYVLQFIGYQEFEGKGKAPTFWLTSGPEYKTEPKPNNKKPVVKKDYI